MSKALFVPSLLRVGAVLLLAVGAAPAHAYLGPGIGGGIAVVLGILGSILLAMISVIWYPVKRLLRRLRKGKVSRKPGPPDESSSGI